MASDRGLISNGARMATRLMLFLGLVLPAILLHKTPVISAQNLNGCGANKGCFKQPVDCTGNDCRAYVTWETTADNQTRFSMRAMAAAWVAVGLRPSNATGNGMIPADVYACTNKNAVRRSENKRPGGSLNSVDKAIPTGAITDASVIISDNIISCMFTRKPNVADDPKFYDISGTNMYKVLLAIGDNINTDGTISTRTHQGRWSTATAVSLQLDFSPPPTAQSEERLAKAHASLMVIAWVGFASIGITLARYFKPMWPTSKLLGQKVWFTIHRTCMVTCMVCFITAFILIFVNEKGFVDVGETIAVTHAVLGIIVTILGIVNPIMALFRPHPGTPNRPYFNWAHFLVGILAHLGGLTTVLLGIGYNSSGLLDGLPDYVFIVTVVFVVFHFLIWILFEVQRCMTESIARNNDIPLKGSGNADSTNHLTGTEDDPPMGSTAKSILLAVYILGVFITVVFLVICFALVKN